MPTDRNNHNKLYRSHQWLKFKYGVCDEWDYTYGYDRFKQWALSNGWKEKKKIAILNPKEKAFPANLVIVDKLSEVPRYRKIWQDKVFPKKLTKSDIEKIRALHKKNPYGLTLGIIRAEIGKDISDSMVSRVLHNNRWQFVEEKHKRKEDEYTRIKKLAEEKEI